MSENTGLNELLELYRGMNQKQKSHIIDIALSMLKKQQKAKNNKPQLATL